MQIKTKFVSSHTADSKPVKQEVNSTVILPPLVFPALGNAVAVLTVLALATLADIGFFGYFGNAEELYLVSLPWLP